jgi:hypothetical protein
MVLVAWVAGRVRVSFPRLLARGVSAAVMSAAPAGGGGRRPGGPAGVGQGGPWLRRTRFPSGLVNVVVPSPLRAMVQPHRWMAIR